LNLISADLGARTDKNGGVGYTCTPKGRNLTAKRVSQNGGTTERAAVERYLLD